MFRHRPTRGMSMWRSFKLLPVLFQPPGRYVKKQKTAFLTKKLFVWFLNIALLKNGIFSSNFLTKNVVFREREFSSQNK